MLIQCLRTWIQGNTNQFCPKCKKPIEIQSGSQPSRDDNQNNLNVNNVEQLANNAPILIAANVEKPLTQKDELETFEMKKAILDNALVNLTMENAAVLARYLS